MKASPKPDEPDDDEELDDPRMLLVDEQPASRAESRSNPVTVRMTPTGP
jgi:hypothetical protein